MAEILEAFGLDLDTHGTARTPERFPSSHVRLHDRVRGRCEPAHRVPHRVSGRPGLPDLAGDRGAIPFFALCEHHALPFYGVAHVGYIAHDHIIGISKLTRLVSLFARRFTVQERMGQHIADTLEQILEPHGVAVHSRPITSARRCGA